MELIESYAVLLFIVAISILFVGLFLDFLIGRSGANNTNKVILQAAILILSLSAAFRDGLGYDYFSYLSMYESQNIFSYFYKGPLFILAVYVFNFLSISYPVFLFIVAFLTLQFLSLGFRSFFVRNYIQIFSIILMVYLVVSFFGQIRQLLALSVFFYFLSVKQFSNTIGLVLGAMIHPSLLLLAPAIFKFNSFFLTLHVSIALILIATLLGYFEVVFIVISFLDSLFPFFPYFGKILDYHEYWEVEGMSLSLITMFLFLSFYMVFLPMLKRDSIGRLFASIHILGVIICLLLLSDSHLYGRVMKVFRLFDFLMVMRVATLVKGRLSIILPSLLVVLAFAIMVKDFLRLQSI